MRSSVIAVVLIALLSATGTSTAQETAAGLAAAQQYRPFDKSTIPLLRSVPREASNLDRRVFSTLGQDEMQLVPCMWQHIKLGAAREASQRLASTDLMPSTYQGTGGSVITDTIMAPLMALSYRDIDKHDLWTSRNWNLSPFIAADNITSRMAQAWNDSIRPSTEADAKISSLKTEGLDKFFKHSKSVIIAYRSQPEAPNGLESIVFGLNEELVKFKEANAAANQYCKDLNRGPALVAGWSRSCAVVDTRHDVGGVNLSSNGGDQDTLMTIGFACSAGGYSVKSPPLVTRSQIQAMANSMMPSAQGGASNNNAASRPQPDSPGAKAALAEIYRLYQSGKEADDHGKCNEGAADLRAMADLTNKAGIRLDINLRDEEITPIERRARLKFFELLAENHHCARG